MHLHMHTHITHKEEVNNNSKNNSVRKGNMLSCAQLTFDCGNLSFYELTC